MIWQHCKTLNGSSLESADKMDNKLSLLQKLKRAVLLVIAIIKDNARFEQTLKWLRYKFNQMSTKQKCKKAFKYICIYTFGMMLLLHLNLIFSSSILNLNNFDPKELGLSKASQSSVQRLNYIIKHKQMRYGRIVIANNNYEHMTNTVSTAGYHKTDNIIFNDYTHLAMVRSWPIRGDAQAKEYDEASDKFIDGIGLEPYTVRGSQNYWVTANTSGSIGYPIAAMADSQHKTNFLPDSAITLNSYNKWKASLNSYILNVAGNNYNYYELGYGIYLARANASRGNFKSTLIINKITGQIYRASVNLYDWTINYKHTKVAWLLPYPFPLVLLSVGYKNGPYEMQPINKSIGNLIQDGYDNDAAEQAVD